MRELRDGGRGVAEDEGVGERASEVYEEPRAQVRVGDGRELPTPARRRRGGEQLEGERGERERGRGRKGEGKAGERRA